MIDCGKPSCQMIWLFVRGRHCHTETDAFCCSCHCRDNCQWFIDRPLCAGDFGGIQISLIYIVAPEDVSDEYAMEFRLFQELRKFHPMVDIVKFMGMIVRMSPESRRLMAAACMFLYCQL